MRSIPRVPGWQKRGALPFTSHGGDGHWPGARGETRRESTAPPLPNPSPAHSHLVDVDGDVDDDMKKVAQGQAGDEDVGAIPHTLVLVDDPQQRGIADDAQDEDEAGHHRVDVLESLLDLRLPGAHGGRG